MPLLRSEKLLLLAIAVVTLKLPGRLLRPDVAEGKEGRNRGGSDLFRRRKRKRKWRSGAGGDGVGVVSVGSTQREGEREGERGRQRVRLQHSRV